MKHPTVLVFLELPDPVPPSTGFLHGFKYPDAEIIGFYQVDDDESIGDVRDENEEAFGRALEEIAEQFEQEGVRTETEVEYSGDLNEARKQIAERDAVDAILIPGDSHTIGNVLIAARDLRNADEMMNVLHIIDDEDLVKITLLHVADPDDPDAIEEGERILDEMESLLVDQDVEKMAIEREIREDSDPEFVLSSVASDYDLVVVGESEQDLEQQIFGPVADQISDRTGTPVLIIR